MQKIRVEIIVHADIQKVWDHWNDSESIKGWAHASSDWECPYAENDVKVGGRFLTRMSAKDGSVSFDFTGIYTEVALLQRIAYTMDKASEEQVARTCFIVFEKIDENTTKIIEEFDPENINPIEMQKSGWLTILENFKKFVESR